MRSFGFNLCKFAAETGRWVNTKHRSHKICSSLAPTMAAVIFFTLRQFTQKFRLHSPHTLLRRSNVKFLLQSSQGIFQVTMIALLPLKLSSEAKICQETAQKHRFLHFCCFFAGLLMKLRIARCTQFKHGCVVYNNNRKVSSSKIQLALYRTFTRKLLLRNVTKT